MIRLTQTMSIPSLSKTRLTAMLAAAIFAASPSLSVAKTTSGTLRTSVTVDTSCRTTLTDLAFGNATLFSGQMDATTTIALSCGPGVNYSVAIDNGRYFNGQRRMYGGVPILGLGSYVTYQLYRNAARTQVWGATAGTMVTGTTPANGKALLTVYGRVPNSIVFARPYQDTVTVTVNF